MWFVSDVVGPVDLGAMLVAFVEVYDDAGELFNPDGALVHVQTSDGVHRAYLNIGSKGPGKCEFAPLMGATAQYQFRLEYIGAGGPDDMVRLSDWATCDLSLPFVGDKPAGQLHKSFFVRFHLAGDAPPPPLPGPDPDCENCAVVAQLQAEKAQLEGVVADLRALFVTGLQISDRVVAQ